ncbi:MAG: flagellar hook-length control protein FliK [Paracoccaceae bacterium]
MATAEPAKPVRTHDGQGAGQELGQGILTAITAPGAADGAAPVRLDGFVGEIANMTVGLDRSPLIGGPALTIPAASLLHHPPQLVHAVAQQLAGAIETATNRPVELTLSPEELGRVRMTLAASGEAGLTLTISADRPETIDLMRRHIDQLAQDFRDLGYRNLSFNFSRDEQPQGHQHDVGQENGRHPDHAEPARPDLPTQLAPVAVPSGLQTADRLDLRL